MEKTPPTPKLAYDLAQARAVMEAGGIISATLTASDGYWHVEFVTREAGAAQLVTDKRDLRLFARSDLALKVLRGIGLTRASVEMVSLDVAAGPTKRWSRPDAAAGLKEVHEKARPPNRAAKPKKNDE